MPVPAAWDLGADMGSGWRARDFLELGALDGAVPCARLHTRCILREWDMGRLGERAELVVSELLTNAVKASQGLHPPTPVRLWLLPGGTGLLILVWDTSPQQPAPRGMAADDAEGGRGLLLVEALSVRWGWYTPTDIPGKVTWAFLQ